MIDSVCRRPAGAPEVKVSAAGDEALAWVAVTLTDRFEKQHDQSCPSTISTAFDRVFDSLRQLAIAEKSELQIIYHFYPQQ